MQHRLAPFSGGFNNCAGSSYGSLPVAQDESMRENEGGVEGGVGGSLSAERDFRTKVKDAPSFLHRHHTAQIHTRAACQLSPVVGEVPPAKIAQPQISGTGWAPFRIRSYTAPH